MIFFFFNDTATTEIYTLSLHDALPIFLELGLQRFLEGHRFGRDDVHERAALNARKERTIEILRVRGDRKSTRLNSSHSQISYAVFCLKKKKKPPTLAHTVIVSDVCTVS